MLIVSINIPCHNGEATIADAIRSVQNQTFTDWELLVVDDALLMTLYGLARSSEFSSC